MCFEVAKLFRSVQVTIVVGGKKDAFISCCHRKIRWGIMSLFRKTMTCLVGRGSTTSSAGRCGEQGIVRLVITRRRRSQWVGTLVAVSFLQEQRGLSIAGGDCTRYPTMKLAFGTLSSWEVGALEELFFWHKPHGAHGLKYVW